MKRQTGLCARAGHYCSNEIDLLIGSVCLERTVNYCCFNSKLARIIQEQGRPLLGKNFGSGESPDCSGLTIREIMSMDLSRIDFSEFIGSIKVKTINLNQINNQVNQSVQQGNTTAQKVEEQNRKSRISSPRGGQ
jgi:conjugal transfer mating pair stabilization protein TraN